MLLRPDSQTLSGIVKPMNLEAIQIVSATFADAAKVAEVLTDATKTKVAYGDTAWGVGEWTVEEVEPLIEHSATYLAHVGGELAGTVGVVWDSDPNWSNASGKAAYIHRLAVKQKFQGMGLGKELIEQVLTVAAQKGYEYVRLDCDANNGNLCAYYEHSGFARVGTKPTENPNYFAALYEHRLNL